MTREYAETAVIQHQTIQSIVDNVDQARRDVEQAFTFLLGAKERLKSVLGCDNTHYDSLWSDRISDYDLKKTGQKVQAHIAQNAWRYVLAQTEIMVYMTEQRRKELYEQLNKGDFPTLTVANVLSTLQGMHDQLGNLLLESVREVFQWLRPRNDDHKTNKKYKIGSKVIILNAVDSHYGGEAHINYWREVNFRSLGNVLSLLDGQGVQKYPHDLITHLRVALKSAPWGEWVDVPYMRCKPYGNGNLHVQFVRQDLVDRLNQLGANSGAVGEKE